MLRPGYALSTRLQEFTHVFWATHPELKLSPAAALPVVSEWVVARPESRIARAPSVNTWRQGRTDLPNRRRCNTAILAVPSHLPTGGTRPP